MFLTYASICDIIMHIENRIFAHRFGGFFILIFYDVRTFCADFFFNKNRSNMQMILIENPDDTKIVPYKLARIVYAETNASSLPTVEAMASMIYNIHIQYNKSFKDIANDVSLFEALDEKSKRHQYLCVPANDRKFQMCLRIVQKMIRGNLRDTVFGATKFHHDDVIPDWAMSRGYIAEFDDVLFYL